MNLLSWIGQKITLTSRKFWGAYFGGPTWAGQPVTADTAMQISAVYRAVRLTATTLATLPIHIYERGRDGAMRPAESNDLDFMVRVQPNADQTSVEFWESLIGCQQLVGNGYARKLFRGTGASRTCIGLEVLNPARTRAVRLASEGNRLVYETTDENGRLERLEPDEVFHLKGFGFGGDYGLSPIAMGAQTLSGARAADKIAGEFFRNGMLQAGFVETDKILADKDRDRLQATLSQYVGAESRGLMVLEAGMKYRPIELNPEDAQLLMTRKFNIEEIARWYGIPPVLLYHTQEGQTMFGSGVESIMLSWYTLGLREIIVRTQKAFAMRVMTPAQRQRYELRFNIDGLLQGDSDAQQKLYSSFVQNGIMTRNEVRRLQNLPPVDGGDELTAQVNLVPLTQLGQESGANGTREALRSWLGIGEQEDRHHETRPH